MTPPPGGRLDEEGLDHLLLVAQLPIPPERRPGLLRRVGPMLGLANRLSTRMRTEEAAPAALFVHTAER